MRRSAPELFPRASTKAIACTALVGASELRAETAENRLGRRPCRWLRPSFIFSSMTGTVDQLAYPLLLAGMVFPRGC